MFENLNLTPISLRILLFLARSPDKEFYERELASLTKTSTGGAHYAVKTLKAMGLITEEPSGKNIYYTINTKNASIPCFKIFMTLQELHPLVRRLEPLTQKIIVFGSCATGQDTMESDIDLFILTTEKASVLKVLGKSIGGRPLQPVVLSAVELLNMKENNEALHQEITRGITVWDDNP